MNSSIVLSVSSRTRAKNIGMELGSNVTSQESELLEDALVGLTKVKGQLCGNHSLTDVRADVVPLVSVRRRTSIARIN